ncbi:hypothetical protein M408DRAFT_119542 [Serendipita vermifera MAFF 305830]|uniref:Uncharacterized protein n=1 Tax=Serendipita vermifera MAFF 305830 TaxID=933852 RepID=A0A0C2WSR4_SERVB|nr:hypothetical protein M408DRAFT_119542 [Serendipita vermifera MAFF 305830]
MFKKSPKAYLVSFTVANSPLHDDPLRGSYWRPPSSVCPAPERTFYLYFLEQCLWNKASFRLELSFTLTVTSSSPMLHFFSFSISMELHSYDGCIYYIRWLIRRQTCFNGFLLFASYLGLE